MVNQFERIKQSGEPLAVGRNLAHYAREGWREIPEDDVERLKVFGLALRQRTPGHFMMRIRVPAGRLTPSQLETVGRIAERFGQDQLDITTRAQLQLRWIRIEHIPAIIEQLKAVGLLTLQTLMDSVRNIITCPLAGLCPHEVIDVQPTIDAIERQLVNRPEFVDLPRKINIAVVGCGGHACATHSQDIALLPARRTTRTDQAIGFNVLVGGKASGNTARAAEPLDVFATPADAALLVAQLVGLYRDHGPRDTRSRSRLAHLVEQWGMHRLRDELERVMARPLSRAGAPIPGPGLRGTVGVLPQRQADRVAVGLHVPVGQLAGGDAQRLGGLARGHGGGIRLTEHQNLMLTDVPRHTLDRLRHEPILERYSITPHPLQAGTQSCTGSAFCAMSAIDTKRRARELADELASRLPEWSEDLRIHWSGCRAGCGRHIVADIGLLGRRVRNASGEMVEAVDIYLGGSAADPVTAGTRVREAVPCDELADVIERLVRSGAVGSRLSVLSRDSV